MEYKITWMIELDAESPDDAAFKALEIQRDVNSTANHFTVEDESGNKVGIEIGSVTLKFENDEEPSGIDQIMDLLESISNPESNETPIYLTVESHQGVVVEVNAYQSKAKAYNSEQEWLQSMGFKDSISRELHEDQGTAFQVFATNLLS